MSKVAKNCVLEKNKSHFVSRISSIYEIGKMTEFKNWGYVRIFLFWGFLGSLKNIAKIRESLGFFLGFFSKKK
jgi:hypothetical protein